jgi:hypothetical protein
MKKLDPRLRSVLEVTIFILIFGGFTVFQTWRSAAPGEWPLLALATLAPILLVSILVVWNASRIVDALVWLTRNPQKAFAGIFFFLALVPIVPLSIAPESLLPTQKILVFLTIPLNLVLGLAAFRLPTNPNRQSGAFFILALLLTTALTVAAVARW